MWGLPSLLFYILESCARAFVCGGVCSLSPWSTGTLKISQKRSVPRSWIKFGVTSAMYGLRFLLFSLLKVITRCHDGDISVLFLKCILLRLRGRLNLHYPSWDGFKLFNSATMFCLFSRLSPKFKSGRQNDTWSSFSLPQIYLAEIFSTFHCRPLGMRHIKVLTVPNAVLASFICSIFNWPVLNVFNVQNTR